MLLFIINKSLRCDERSTVKPPNSHIFKTKNAVTIWVPGGFRIKGIDFSIRMRFLFIIRKNTF